MKIFQELSTVERALDVRGQRHTVLAGNLANADTPGFAPLDVDFEAAMAAGELSAGANAGDPSAAERAAGMAAAPSTAEDLAGRPGLDGNSVDLDKTMIALAENGMQYGAAARAASKKLGILRYVASDGVG